MDLQTLLGPAFPYVEPVLGWVVGLDYPRETARRAWRGPPTCVPRPRSAVRRAARASETLNHVLAYAKGPAASALSAYWEKFSTDNPGYVEELAKACEDAAKRLEAFGLDTDYTQKTASRYA